MKDQVVYDPKAHVGTKELRKKYGVSNGNLFDHFKRNSIHSLGRIPGTIKTFYDRTAADQVFSNLKIRKKRKKHAVTMFELETPLGTKPSKVDEIFRSVAREIILERLGL